MKQLIFLCSVGICFVVISLWAKEVRQKPFDLSAQLITGVDTTAAGYSQFSDTFDITSAKDVKSYILDGVVEASPYTTHGFGNADSANLFVYTVHNSTWKVLDSAKGAIPLTFHVARLGVDTTLYEDFRFVVRVVDSITTTTDTGSYRIRGDMLLVK